MFEILLKKCNEIYKELKKKKYPYTAPELLPNEIGSDQVKAVIEVMAKEILELRNEIKIIKMKSDVKG